MSPLFSLFVYTKKYRFNMVLASICSVLNTIFDIMPELLIGVAINVVVQGPHSVIAYFGIVDLKMQLVALALFTLFIFVLESLTQYGYAVLWRLIAQGVQHELRIKAYDHLQKLPMAYYEDKASATLMSVLNDDINQLERFLDDGIYQFIYLITSTVVSFSVFMYLSPKIAFLSLIPLPLVFVITFYFQRKLEPRYLKVRERASDLADRLLNNIAGIATIKSYTSKNFELSRVEKDSSEYFDANKQVIQLSAAFIPVIRIIIALGFVVSLIVGGWQVIDGILDVGGYSVLVFQTQRLLWPFSDFADMVDFYGKTMASVKRVLNLLQEEPEVVKGTQRLQVQDVKGDVQFNHVTFVYPDGTKIFNNLNLHIAPGQTVAFVGTTGSGKSTLIKLLLRFYDPTSGTILLDGTDITTINPNDLRRVIAVVSQDVFLFKGTVRENIAYGMFDTPLEAVIAAAKIAEAHEFIMQLPQGYETILGERGLKLSGGQRQRLSIARAVLKKSPILIFDEATSAIDNETEAAIQRSLATIIEDHTVIVIAHRLSTIRNADIIFVMQEGVIVESGTHQELLAKKGAYSSLWHVQTGE